VPEPELEATPRPDNGPRWTARVHAADLDREGERLLAGVVERVAAGGGGPLTLWVLHARPDHDTVAAGAALAFDRELLQLRRPLPVDEPVDLAVRSFRPGTDDAAWLAVNNRAFAGHPEQGGWEQATLDARRAEPWFDADGFLLHEDGEGRIDGFCWTKVHADHDPPLGEIYAIAVDPSAAGQSLGHGLVLAGLDWLHRHGLTVGMLYVDAANQRAVRLYERLGFTPHHADRAYRADVLSPPSTSDGA